MSELELIKQMRDQTGAGIADIKEALAACGGDPEQAMVYLRKKGQKIAAKRQDRTTSQGCIETYVHANGKVASMVAVACETDFVARNSDFRNFVHELALQVAATAPQYISPEEIPADVVEREKEIFRGQLADEKKPANIIDKIIDGKMEKFYSEVCLLKQKYIKDDSKTVEDLLNETIAKIGESIKVVKFIHFTL